VPRGVRPSLPHAKRLFLKLFELLIDQGVDVFGRHALDLGDDLGRRSGFVGRRRRLARRLGAAIHLQHLADHVAGETLQRGIVEQQRGIEMVADRTTHSIGKLHSGQRVEAQFVQRAPRVGQVGLVDGQHPGGLLPHVQQRQFKPLGRSDRLQLFQKHRASVAGGLASVGGHLGEPRRLGPGRNPLEKLRPVDRQHAGLGAVVD